MALLEFSRYCRAKVQSPAERAAEDLAEAEEEVQALERETGISEATLTLDDVRPLRLDPEEIPF